MSTLSPFADVRFADNPPLRVADIPHEQPGYFDRATRKRLNTLPVNALAVSRLPVSPPVRVLILNTSTGRIFRDGLTPDGAERLLETLDTTAPKLAAYLELREYSQ